ncbi:hypothetical protein CN884_07825 [Ochrobactrum sp. 30A/1000/2015]|nr:hypothetical protein A4G21_12870 [Brucella intermedia]OAE38766.1 hypothetical protein A7J42_17840 [Brucella intermedia]PJT24814.1 hypothetical protein CN884_07825 [Ochrobactrum sp. 30A/1000/2015]PJT40263.1 hypothetical protein CN883_01810 [Ochrobactrum sp. 27A/999/2015]PJT43104.1 hypothetical protein CN882_14240 [Ochrobactrum sp. 23A/997/2015]
MALAAEEFAASTRRNNILIKGDRAGSSGPAARAQPLQPMEVKMEYRDKNVLTEWKETPDSGVKVQTDYQCYAFLLIPSPGDDNELAPKHGTALVSARSEADARVVASQGETEAFRGQVAIGDTDLTTNDFSAFRNEKSYQVHRVSDEPIDTPRGVITMERNGSND